LTTVAVAAPHPVAVSAARHAVAEGGGAIAAALAAAAALTVVYPHQCSLGGDLTALVRHPDGRVQAMLSIGAAAAGVDVAELRAAGPMPGAGPHTVTVPGVVAGWAELALLGGSADGLGRALRYAAGLAADGVRVSAGLARGIAYRLGVLGADDPGLLALLTADGKPLTEGDALLQPRLAATLLALADDPRAFYDGAVGATLAAALSRAGSRLTPADFAAHRAETVPPLTLDVGGVRWWAAPPPSQGATLLALLRSTGPLVGAARRASAARDRLLGDPRRGPVDLDGLLRPAPAGPAAAAGRHAGDTVGITAVDTAGWAVSIIQSVYQTFGSGICEPETGIVLHNRGSAFSLEDGHPALVGPGIRPPHTLCPLIGRTDRLLIALGCQGGRAQPQILAQTAPALADPTVPPAAVLARPRWVVGARDLGYARETLHAEPGASFEAPPDLPLMTTPGPDDDCGHIQVARLHTDGLLDAAADPRADGAGAVLCGDHQETP
jgi:gamma-glutamyltranspeptidase